MLFHRSFLALAATVFLAAGCQTPAGASNAARSVDFIITADTREFTPPKHPGPDYFEGVCAAINKVGAGQFMISPGDIDPMDNLRASLSQHMGTNYIWYPVVGNHEAETRADMAWLRAWGSNAIPGLVRRGPAGSETTTFSFDHGPAHFVILNQYFDGTSDYKGKGDVVDKLYEWLKADLEQNERPLIFVIGHEPVLPVPDMDNGRLRHEKDSLNANAANCRRFKELLIEKRVLCYVCAHTHNASMTDLGGVWQIDPGHARGAKGDKGAPSTFVKITGTAQICTIEFHRQFKAGEPYRVSRRYELKVPERPSRL